MSELAHGGDPILDGLQRAIPDYTEDVAHVTKYVVIAEWIDGDGDRRTYTDTMEGQLGWETLGLLVFGQTYEQARIAKLNVFDDDDD